MKTPTKKQKIKNNTTYGGIIHDDDCFCRGCYAVTWPKLLQIRHSSIKETENTNDSKNGTNTQK